MTFTPLSASINSAGGGEIQLLARHYPAGAAPSGFLLFCLPGGGASCGYFDLGEVGGFDYSFAARMTALGRSSGELLGRDESIYLHSHISEHTDEVSYTLKLFPDATNYVDVYDSFGMVGARSGDDWTERMLAYNADRKAYIRNAQGGPYSDLVKAAERCTARVIHPGLPHNASEAGMDKWIARGSKFN